MPRFSRSLIRSAALSVVFLISAVILLAAAWLLRLNSQIVDRFSQKRFLPPIEFFTGPLKLTLGLRVDEREITHRFQSLHFSLRPVGTPLQEGDYIQMNQAECLATAGPNLPQEWQTALTTCWLFRNRPHKVAGIAPPEPQLILWSKESGVLMTYRGDPLVPVENAVIEPVRFAQYYGDKPILRTVVSRSEVPPICLNSLIAIEDSAFFEHSGISWSGIFRAVIANLRHGQTRQGGSTLTQQLIKNYFLTDERTLKRKLTEIAMAILIETNSLISKDDILETYINLIYMGQSGPFEVRGFAAASEHYFGKKISDLGTSECALLAALVNGPGVFDPFSKPDRAVKRRNKVIDRLLELKYIDELAAAKSAQEPLPTKASRIVYEPAPYFVASARRWIAQNNIDSSDGLLIYTALNPAAQEAAQLAVRNGIKNLEDNIPHLKKAKEKGKNLEAILVAVDIQTGWIEAIVGGRGFLSSPFNRVYDAHRQVGSTMKPLVYLAALEAKQADGSPYNALSLLHDISFKHKYEGQTWSPRNYDGKTNGLVPMYWALKESLNIATAQLGIDIGLDKIVQVARRAGIQAKLESYPSLALGAFEIAPAEMVQAYTTIARLGSRVSSSPVLAILTPNGNPVWTVPTQAEQVFSAEDVAQLLGMMKETLRTGTARSIFSPLARPAAGKTGTTNDKRDAWFVGLLPQHVAVVWVGYDDNTPHGLTGASAAAPTWLNYMLGYGRRFPAVDFGWPENTEIRTVDSTQLKNLGVTTEKALTEAGDDLKLVFEK